MPDEVVIKDTVIEGNPGYLIYFDHVRVDQYVKDFSVNLTTDGSMGSATINMIYVPDLDKVIHNTNSNLKQVISDSSTKTTTTTKRGKDYGINSWPSILKKGSTGSSVKQLQQWLLDLGYKEVTWVDGIFGPRTQKAVRRFQKDNGCKVDGIVGPKTKAAFKKKIKTTTTTTTSKSSGSQMIVNDGVENMTNVRIFVKNIFSEKYIQIFEGNIRSKASSISGGEYMLTFQAIDYMNWLNRTICPLAVPLDNTLTTGDRLRWKAQGIDIKKVKTVTTIKDVNFKGKNISQVWEQISKQTINSNPLYTEPNSVAAWDNVLSRIAIMGDIDEKLRNAQVVDFVVSNSVTSVNSIYVLMNDILRVLMFEFYQDRDGVIRIKPPFWNEHVLTNHVIDASMIVNFNESVNWNNLYTRILVTGGLDDWAQPKNDQTGIETSILTPVVAYTSSGVKSNSGPVVVTSASGGSTYSAGNATGENIVNYARTLIGIPYKFGGKHPSTGLDCSGLVWYVYKNFGIALPHGSYNQVNVGKSVSINELQPGDLLFYGSRSNIHHVTIYSGNGKMIEAYATGYPVRETTMRTPSCCRRIIGNTGHGRADGAKGMPQSVGADELLKLTEIERKYGPLLYDITQPLIKFSTSKSVNNSNNAYDALTKYAKFMLNYLNSAVSIASVTTIAMPWVRPGFNVWIDPVRINKVYYVTSISHQGSPSGCFTTLNLVMGRNMEEFLNAPNLPGSLRPGSSDDIFVNKLLVKPENFGTICNYKAIQEACKEYHKSVDATDIDVSKAVTNGFLKRLYAGDNSPSKFSPPANTQIKIPSTKVPKRKNINFNSWPGILKYGNKGSAVKELQQVLMDLGYKEVTWVDGIFGPKTKAAVLRFQKEHRLNADALVGPKTKAMLKKVYNGGTTRSSSSSSTTSTWRYVMKRGHSGSDVASLQSVLKNLGYSEVGAVDGIFGAKTNAAVRRFQKNNGCKVDGMVGPQTRAAIERALSKKSSSNSVSRGTQYSVNGQVKGVTGELTKSEINEYLQKKYSSAPPVVQTRRKRLESIVEHANTIMRYLYSTDGLL